MKKFITFFLLSILILNSTSVLVFSKDITPEAHYAIAIDGKTKKILYEKRAFENEPMSSTTKMLTALIAINYGNLDDQVEISKNAASLETSPLKTRSIISALS